MTRILPFVLLLAACGAAEPAPAAQTSDDPAPAAQTGNGEPAAAGDCAAGGVPDDGDAEGCNFRVSSCCYSVAAHACAAAGCTEDRCTIMESYPAQVACN